MGVRMPRKPREKTLVISEEDNARLDELCSDPEIGRKVTKAWLGQVCLRYGMRHRRAAIQDEAARLAMLFPADEADVKLNE